LASVSRLGAVGRGQEFVEGDGDQIGGLFPILGDPRAKIGGNRQANSAGSTPAAAAGVPGRNITMNLRGPQLWPRKGFEQGPSACRRQDRPS